MSRSGATNLRRRTGDGDEEAVSTTALDKVIPLLEEDLVDKIGLRALVPRVFSGEAR
jgi:hypothetical protein